MTDLHVQNHGSIFILQATSPAGEDWIAENIAEDSLRWGVNGVVVEPRYIEAIIDGATNDGLEVS